MSRTFRRKNYEDVRGRSWDRAGRKTAGFYTHRDCNTQRRFGCTGYFKCVWTYRPMTKREWDKEHRRIHGESHQNYWGPGRPYKQYRMEENRVINKAELVKWKKYPDDYEPMFEEEPRSHWWDW